MFETVVSLKRRISGDRDDMGQAARRARPQGSLPRHAQHLVDADPDTHGCSRLAFRSVLGIKVFGPDLNEIGRIGRAIEQTLSTVPGTRSAFAERTTGGLTSTSP